MRSLIATHRGYSLLLLAALFVLFLGLPTLVIPLSADQSWFALGARTILDGDQLYRDFHEQKTPLIYILYAIPQAIAGESFQAIRVLDLGAVLLAMAGIYSLTRRFLPERAAIAAAAVYAFIYLTTAGFDGLAETESFIIGPLTLGLALYPAAGGSRTLQRALASGFFLGVAFSLKFSVAPFVLMLPVMELLLRDRRSWRPLDAIVRLAVAALGFLFIQAIWLGYLALAGTLDDFVDIVRGYTLPYQGERWSPSNLSFTRHLLNESEKWLSSRWFITAPAFVGVIALLLRTPRQAGYVFGLLLALAIGTVWWQSKFFLYHWLIAIPFMAIPAGYLIHRGLDELWGMSRAATIVAVAAAVFGMGLLLARPLLDTYDAYNYLYDREAGSRTQAQIDAIYVDPLRYNHELVDYVLANSGPDEGFVIWGTWPQALLWADRPSPTNFITSPPVRADWTPEKWREEYVEDLRSDPPRFFAVSSFDHQPWLTGHDRSSRQDFCDTYPELRAFIEASYQPVFENTLFLLYDRDAAQPSAASACP